jgi:protein TonB
VKSVKSVSIRKTKPNWLMRGLIGVSFVIHLIIFMHVAGIYHSKALTYIELTLRDVSKPPSRSIPRPRIRPKPAVVPKDPKRLNVPKTAIPKHKPFKMEKADAALPDSLVERISMPEIPDQTRLEIAAWDHGIRGEESDYITSDDYFEMVRLRVERHKEYPAAARMRQIEGRAMIGFVIAPDGRLSGLKVIKSSRNKALDLAAVSAIQDAAPFPRPPANLFKGSVSLKLTIVFELT